MWQHVIPPGRVAREALLGHKAKPGSWRRNPTGSGASGRANLRSLILSTRREIDLMGVVGRRGALRPRDPAASPDPGAAQLCVRTVHGNESCGGAGANLLRLAVIPALTSQARRSRGVALGCRRDCSAAGPHGHPRRLDDRLGDEVKPESAIGGAGARNRSRDERDGSCETAEPPDDSPASGRMTPMCVGIRSYLPLFD